ncbi:MAG TPA: isocitrate lyase/phosphoenolpyruvate mutase family protein [Candidatus Binataceae bacterium]|nr:isocitrate lyase/phosphoenolpyruvate mutase family protein [Candidatus Binataceae bacterium]
MEPNTQRQKAEALRAMHDRSRILVLVNVWDAMSARATEEAGARAIATSSATMANALGYPDGEVAPREEIAAAIARIARVVEAPVTADIESGFGRTPADVADTIRMVIEAGAVGVNLEDSIQERRGELYEVPQALERLAAAREASTKAGVPLVINARTDVFLLGVGPRESRLDHAVRRATAYRKAGADCLFVPGVRDAQTIAELARRINGPLNVLAGPGTPPVAELERMGVARVSVGSWPGLAAMTVARKAAQELLGAGTYGFIAADTITYPEANAMMKRRGAAARA